MRSPWRYSTSCAQRKLFRTVASAIGGSNQAFVIENGRISNLGSVKRGYFIRPDVKGERSLLAYMLGHPSSFDSSSVAFVNANMCARVMNKPDNPRYIPVNPRGTQPPLRRLGHVQEVSAASVSQTRTAVDPRCPWTCWKEFSIMSKEEITTYRMRSFRRRSSSTSPGGVAKRSSSTTIRERRSSILFMIAAISCSWIRQRSILSRES